MTRTFADMTPEERDACVGMWATFHRSVDPRPVIIWDWSGDTVWRLSLTSRHEIMGTDLDQITPRFDLPRAWPPDGRPAPLPEPEIDMADPHLAVWESGVTAHPEVVYVPHFLPLDDVELVEQIGIDLMAAAAHVRKQAEKGVGRADA